MNQKLTLSLDLRLVCAALLAIIAVMLGLWQPWDSNTARRTISVTGTGKITATPDNYQFNPSFQKATSAELNAQVAAVTARLKELGVAEKDISLQSSSFSAPKTMIAPAPEQDANYAYITIKVSTKELAQKVQDYITTTDAEGQLTPYPNFSDDKLKQLQEEARDKALTDAKTKAVKTAGNLNAKLGKVVEFKDAENSFGVYPLAGSEKAIDSAERPSVQGSVPIYPGEQEISVSVQAVFEIK